ncbi:universal stress protein [Kocuria sp. M1R5S2]|uniref:universal stress protein n=1 Tax=Kocuria rhizosphaerae TaxID=3376285 RepID=UPI0037ABD1B3
MSIVLAHVPNALGETALRFAINEASVHHTKLVVVNSSRGGALGDPHLASQEQLDELRDLATQAGVEVEVEQPIRNEDPDFEVIDAATRHDAIMIVLAVRRRSTVGKLVMGSTAQRILMEADIPVVAVKPAVPRPTRH